MTLTKVQKARVKGLKALGLRLGVDFEVAEDGVFIFSLDEFVAWQELASRERRNEIAEFVGVMGVGTVQEYDAETQAALNEDVILSMVNPHIGSNGEDKEIVNELLCAQLEAHVRSLLAGEILEPSLEEEEAIILSHQEAYSPEVVMEPEAAREEPLWMITNTGATGVALSERLRKAIAQRVRELFTDLEWTEEVAPQIQKECLAKWGVSRSTQRAAYACKRYAAVVERSLDAQVLAGVASKHLAVNSYWA